MNHSGRIDIEDITMLINTYLNQADEPAGPNTNESTIVDGIDLSLLPGIYEFNGNIAPSFKLYRNGTCEIISNGLSGDITNAKWTYEKTSHTLLVGTHVYTIRLITDESLVAEWTSVKYGTSVSSWVRTDLPEESKSEDFENGHKWVDLGLSVKWATTNIGANKPENFGWYLAWGETCPQLNNSYTWSSYKWGNHSSSNIEMTKYLVSTMEVSLDGKKILVPEDDAAHVNWGGNWRMPTIYELHELRSSCTWLWTTQNGVYGYIVTSTKNGNSIFLPAAGQCGQNGTVGYGSRGLYWSSSLDKENMYEAYHMYISAGEVKTFENYNSYRYFGRSVRPVCP